MIRALTGNLVGALLLFLCGGYTLEAIEANESKDHSYA